MLTTASFLLENFVRYLLTVVSVLIRFHRKSGVSPLLFIIIQFAMFTGGIGECPRGLTNSLPGSICFEHSVSNNTCGEPKTHRLLTCGG